MKHCGTGIIETPRLTLRPFALSDAADLLELWIADEAVQSEYGEPVYETPEAVEALLQRWITGYQSPAFYRWAMIEGETGRCIGQIAFCRVYEDCRAAEIEYCVSRSRWGRGYAGEALQAVFDHILCPHRFRLAGGLSPGGKHPFRTGAGEVCHDGHQHGGAIPQGRGDPGGRDLLSHGSALMGCIKIRNRNRKGRFFPPFSCLSNLHPEKTAKKLYALCTLGEKKALRDTKNIPAFPGLSRDAAGKDRPQATLFSVRNVV